MKNSYLICLLLSVCVLTGNAQMATTTAPTFYVRGVLSPLKKGAATTEQLQNIFKKLIPDNCKGKIVYSLAANAGWYYTQKPSNYTAFVDDNYLDLCKRMDAVGVPFVISVGNVDASWTFGNKPMPNAGEAFTPNVISYFISPEQVATIFQQTKNCVGIESGENFWTYNNANAQTVLSFLRVCKQYGKHYVLGEGGWGYNSFMRFFYDYHSELVNEGLGQYFYPNFKNTKPYGAFVSQSALMGAWLTNKVANYGTWNDEWVWTYASFGNVGEFPIYNKSDKNWELVPYTHYLKSWLLTIAAGGAINFLETPSFNRDGTAKEEFSNYLLPFVEGLVQHHILPSKKAVQQKVKAMANPFGNYSVSANTQKLFKATDWVTYRSDSLVSPNTDPFGRLYNSTYGIWNDTAYTNTGTATDRYYEVVKKRTGKEILPNSLLRELIPNNARYYLIPLLTSPADSLNIPKGIKNLSLNQFNNNQALTQAFNQLYPITTANNQAWATEVDNSFFAINTHENIDLDQTFSFPLNGTISKIEGVLPFQNILFGKREGKDTYWFQSNGFRANLVQNKRAYTCTEKPTVLYVFAATEPKLVIENNKTSAIRSQWDGRKKVLTISIHHNQGAVNFSIVGQDKFSK